LRQIISRLVSKNLPMDSMLTFVVAGVAGLLIVGVVVYYYAGIMVLPGQHEIQLQQTLIQ
jgi:hypothetical protein